MISRLFSRLLTCLIVLIIPITVYPESEFQLSKADLLLLNDDYMEDNRDFSDLAKRLPDSLDRVVNAKVLSAMIIDGPDIETRNIYGVSGNWSTQSRQSPIILRDATIIGHVFVNNANIDEAVRFEDCYFSGDVFIRHTHFRKSLIILSSTINGSLVLTSSTIDGEVLLNNTTIGTSAEFSDSHFRESTSISAITANYVLLPRSVFDRDLSIMKTWDGSLGLQKIRVGESFTLDASLTDDIDLAFSHINGEATIHLRKSNVNAGLLMRDIVTEMPLTITMDDKIGKIQLANSKLHSLNIRSDSQHRIARIEDLELTRSTILNDLTLTFFTVNDLQASSLTIYGEMRLVWVIITKRLDFSRSILQGRAEFTYVHWPPVDSIWFSGMKYDQLPRRYPNSQNSPYWVADSTAFSSDVYKNLRDYYEQVGEPGLAKETVFAMKRRQAENANPVARFLDTFLYHFWGYGLRWWRTAYWSGGLLLIGLLLYRRSEMEARDPREQDRYSVFWYVFDLFLPVVDLGAVDRWHPRCTGPARRALTVQQWIAFHYSKFLPFAGFILVTLFIAGITGLVGR